MTTTSIVLTVVAVVLVCLLAGMILSRRKHTARLQKTFGSEYDRTLQSTGKRKAAEQDLTNRVEKYNALTLQPLTEADQGAFQSEWSNIQTAFVDSPALALAQADNCVTRLMEKRGYPTDGFKSQSELLSVENEKTLENYRLAHESYAHSQDTDTEGQRKAMLHYRKVVEDLMEAPALSGSAAKTESSVSSSGSTSTQAAGTPTPDQTAAGATSMEAMTTGEPGEPYPQEGRVVSQRSR